MTGVTNALLVVALANAVTITEGSKSFLSHFGISPRQQPQQQRPAGWNLEQQEQQQDQQQPSHDSLLQQIRGGSTGKDGTSQMSVSKKRATHPFLFVGSLCWLVWMPSRVYIHIHTAAVNDEDEDAEPQVVKKKKKKKKKSTTNAKKPAAASSSSAKKEKEQDLSTAILGGSSSRNSMQVSAWPHFLSLSLIRLLPHTHTHETNSITHSHHCFWLLIRVVSFLSLRFSCTTVRRVTQWWA